MSSLCARLCVESNPVVWGVMGLSCTTQGHSPGGAGGRAPEHDPPSPVLCSNGGHSPSACNGAALCRVARYHVNIVSFMSLSKSSRQPSNTVSILPIKTKQNKTVPEQIISLGSHSESSGPQYVLPEAHTSLVIPDRLPQKQGSRAHFWA